MTKIRTISFAEFRTFLGRFGFVEKAVPKGRVLQHPEDGLLLFRYYRDDEPVLTRDLLRTRKLLDLRGVIEAGDFDATLLRADTRA